jgi:hypothetical protein
VSDSAEVAGTKSAAPAVSSVEVNSQETAETDVKSAINSAAESADGSSAPASHEVTVPEVSGQIAEAAGGSAASESESESQEPPSRTSEVNLETAEPQSEATEAKSETAEPQSEATDAKSESAEPKSESAELKLDTESKSESGEPKSESTEAKSDSTERKSEATEANSESTERKSEATEARSESTEPKSESAEPKSGSTVVGAGASPPVVQETFVVTRKPALEWFLRVVISFWFLGLALFYWISSSGLSPGDFSAPDPWVLQVTFVTCALTGLGLLKGFRTILSYALSAVDCVFDIKLLKATMKSWAAFKPAFAADRVFIPSSIPHMVGLFLYVQTMFYLLSQMSPKPDFQMPGMPLPMPLPLDQLFSYNGLGLVMLAFCGSGIFVTRSFKEVLSRLALVKPTPPQIMIGLGLVFMSFMYDFVWSLYTHGQHLGLDSKLAGYNGGTFTASGGFTGALILALATAIFAGVGEETLIRGALQPVFGLVPAAILHGVLHAQFQHAPIFIVQVAGWSILMGIAKRYTNTSTTIIGHAGFNFVTTFLFAYNPPDIL